MSILKALPLLLVFPISILSAPSPAPQAPAAPDTSGYIKYRVSAAELRGVKAVGPDKQGISSEGRNNALHFSISGVNPGDQPIDCSSEWFRPDTETSTYVPGIKCSDPGLVVNVQEFGKPTPYTSAIDVFIIYTASDKKIFAQVKWYFETTDTNWWNCDAQGTLCTLKTGFTIDSSGAPVEVAPPNTPEQAPPAVAPGDASAPGTPTEADPPAFSPGDPFAPGGAFTPEGKLKLEEQ
ncbi:MAG: hypothetical protein Q9172_001449 [Xanthocarpia lactea]